MTTTTTTARHFSTSTSTRSRRTAPTTHLLLRKGSVTKSGRLTSEMTSQLCLTPTLNSVRAFLTCLFTKKIPFFKEYNRTNCTSKTFLFLQLFPYVPSFMYLPYSPCNIECLKNVHILLTCKICLLFLTTLNLQYTINVNPFECIENLSMCLLRESSKHAELESRR